jgi:hypothetical protein
MLTPNNALALLVHQYMQVSTDYVPSFQPNTWQSPNSCNSSRI